MLQIELTSEDQAAELLRSLVEARTPQEIADRLQTYRSRA